MDDLGSSLQLVDVPVGGSLKRGNLARITTARKLPALNILRQGGWRLANLWSRWQWKWCLPCQTSEVECQLQEVSWYKEESLWHKVDTYYLGSEILYTILGFDWSERFSWLSDIFSFTLQQWFRLVLSQYWQIVKLYGLTCRFRNSFMLTGVYW